MATYRKKKLEELIKRIVAEAFIREIKDPRIGFITVVRVELKKDYSVANVWVSVIGDESEKKLSLQGVQSASGFIQYIVGKSIRLRVTPQIRFHLDTSLEEGSRILGLIDGFDIKSEETEE